MVVLAGFRNTPFLGRMILIYWARDRVLARVLFKMQETVFQRLKRHASDLTPLERKLADTISTNYPVSGLGSITELAAKAGVSSPTVARLVQKLRFKGFPQFQRALREELDKALTERKSENYSGAENAPKAHAINEVTEAAIFNIRETVQSIDLDDFNSLCDLLSDLNRNVFVAGGTITASHAHHLFVYFQVMRPDVHMLSSDRTHWLHELMGIKPGDVLIVYQIRQYEKRVIRIAEFARQHGAEVILVTDQWVSPISEIATHTMNCRVAMPSGWDTTMGLFLANEAIIRTVKSKLGGVATQRGEKLEQILKQADWFA